ncbi:MAG: T9SS type A sorting domain-containing protein [Bacteroidia bacterium]|nr:T9SS type A sorting domain-containing protein [Bacteroidia bacterium]
MKHMYVILGFCAIVLAQIIPASSNPLSICNSSISFSLGYELQNPPSGAQSYTWSLTISGTSYPMQCGTNFFDVRPSNLPVVNWSNILIGMGTFQVQVSVEAWDGNNQSLGTYTYLSSLVIDDMVSPPLTCTNCNTAGGPPATLVYTAGEINFSYSPTAHPHRNAVLEELIGGNWSTVTNYSCMCGGPSTPCTYTLSYTPNPSLIGQTRSFRLRPTWGNCGNQPVSNQLDILFVDQSTTLHSEQKEFILSPNPSRGEVYIQAPQPGYYRWTLSDLSGRKITEGTFQGSSATLSFPVAPGLYQLHLLGEKYAQRLSLLVIE